MIPHRMLMNGRVSTTLPTRSLQFAASASQYLFMAGGGFGALNSKKWTYHVWFKRSSTGSTQFLVHKVNSASTIQPINILFTSTDKLDIRIRNNVPSIIGRLVTNAAYNDNNWHQLVVYWDTANAVSADRLQLWVDHIRVVSFSTNTQPALNADMYDSIAAAVYIGANSGVASYFDGLLYQQAFFNNALPAVASLHNGVSPANVKGLVGLSSLLHTDITAALEDDFVLAANWGNAGGVVPAAGVPG